MNKKFLSAILFGALMVTSTGTFVSCKDYDDDIKDLQEQINSNKDAIAALQKLVGEGKWVTAISPITNGFTVTMSDGSSQTITGIKGADGKNGTEWSIGEDGFWYKDGEKTAHQAIAKDGQNGENGLTAPSPKISADGHWVVYEWDATKGEFVEKTTDVPAQGTSAYVVEKDGVYELNIANEAGEFVKVVLPATSDSFVVEAPAAVVEVTFDYAKWNPATTNKDYLKLAEKFTALASIEKNALVKQGGNLPLLVTPASVELTDNFAYSLQTVKGKTPNIKISTPTKGLPANIEANDGRITTRSASASDCFWTLQIEPGIENKEYVTVNSETTSLVVENAKGTVVKTAFAYKVFSENLSSKNVSINPGTKTTGKATYAAEVDLLAYDETQKAYPIYIENAYTGYHIITLSNSYEVEKYGLSIADDNKTLNVSKMPSDVTSITIHFNVIALGLNGSVANKDVTVTIGQEVATAGKLANKELTLDGKDQVIKWNIADLGLSAVELDKVLKGTVNMAATREYYNDQDQEIKACAYNGNVTFYNASGAATTYSGNGDWSNGAGVTFGIALNATSAAIGSPVTGYTVEQWTAAEYALSLTSTSSQTVIYSAEATLTTSLPSSLDSFIKLAAGYVDNNILQITGDVTYASNIVTYDLNKALVLNGVQVLSFEDLDYDDQSTDASSAAKYNWITDANNGILTVNTWKTKDDIALWYAAKWNQLYTARNIRANIYFFGNTANAATFDFKATVKSTIYSTTPASAVTMTATKLVSNYGGDAIDIKAAIAKAVYAAGPKKGQEYKLFGSTGSTTQKDVTDYDAPKTSGAYLLNSSTNMVQIDATDLIKLGMSAEDYTKVKDEKIYLTAAEQSTGTLVTGTSSTLAGWTAIMTSINSFYEYNNGTWKQTVKDADLTAAQTIYKELFNKYISKIAFATKKVSVTSTATAIGEGLENGAVSVEFTDVNEAAKYVKTNALASFSVTPLTVDELTVDAKEVKIPMNLVVKDNWGMTMKVPFNITVKTTK